MPGPKGAVEARSLQTFKLTYTTGRYGLDDTGSIRIVFRVTADGGKLSRRLPTLGAYSGLTCFLLDGLTRDDLFDCLKCRTPGIEKGALFVLDLPSFGNPVMLT
jgi:hypothetical protein